MIAIPSKPHARVESRRARYGRPMFTSTRLIVAFVLLSAGCKKSAKEEEKQPQTPTVTAIDAAPPPEVKPYTPSADVTEPIRAAIAATDRTVEDRSLDAGRKPGEVLTF